MGHTMAQKIIKAHLVDGEMVAGSEVGLRIDQTLTQDATGTMAYLEFEAMGIERVKTELSVAYIDHNTLQNGFMNADDHAFIRSIAKKIGVRYARPGCGICHQVHLERFAAPGKTLIGSDSHTPTAGGIACLAIGSGGLDVAVAMGGGAYYIPYPKAVRINLTGTLPPFVGAKDIILEVLRLLSVKGGVGKIIEYTGEGAAALSVPQRATITNMGAELGATTSLFASDQNTLDFLKAQGREQDYVPLCADDDAVYDEEYTIDLSQLQPLAACPHSPDAIVPIAELAGTHVDQVCIGSCTNSSLADLSAVAHILKGQTVAPNVSLTISPGSRQVLQMLSENGLLTHILASGARLLECSCGPCIGMGQSPPSAGVSLRTFNRNFEGRSGTADAGVYLVSPEVAAASAIAGTIADPRNLPPIPEFEMPQQFLQNDNMIDPAATTEEARALSVVRGPNIKPLPQAKSFADTLTLPVLLKVGDNITTDHIMPAGAKILPFRSNIPHLAQFCFEGVDPEFPARAAAAQDGGFIVGGHNYGQGSSREHAALVPLHLGIRAVIVQSFARIHKANLINAGILPLTFANPADIDKINSAQQLTLLGVLAGLDSGAITLRCEDSGEEIALLCDISKRQADIMRAGGLLNYTRASASDGKITKDKGM